MAENQKPRDPYQYERILRQKVQQTFNEQKNAGKPAGGQGGATPPPPVRDSAQELAQSIHELGRVSAQEVGGALGDTTREMGSALRGAARDVRKTAAQQKHQSQAQQAARRAGDALASRMNQAGSSLSSGLRDGLCIFGGTLADGAAAFVAGLVLYLYLLVAVRGRLSKIAANISGGALVCAVAILLTNLGLGSQLSMVTVGSLVPLLPGVAFTNAIRDIADEDYISGAVRMLDVFLVVVCMAFGVGFVMALWARLGGVLA